ncbi:hypothetical protein SARC_12547 [Sphaeroforma arctica JP610]|uniref:ADF-H domain-containing protein n=1 Tax=Sphaeroforma arctica JP610 TaxID=667725 RepID=A0A0L0FDR5_9EUKA|nr:hypothetical protein SARC_12547 [Sphaeroforma arctica JP610]KNC74917.1 hypothetical protein SARC_12547 [Sphaeroforma arctica JP610]|eukprot:XP_014148819.1 hypothetical protein SARC_12547 [Sphaeroforma arctica JP610]
MSILENQDTITEAYEDVRNDNSDTEWLFLAYNDANKVYLESKGTGYDNLLAKFTDDIRAYAFVRVETGDELSKRAKFALITWIGDNVGALKKAKVSVQKSEVKAVIKSVAAEVLANDKGDVAYKVLDDLVRKAGGANYGTGSR